MSTNWVSFAKVIQGRPARLRVDANASTNKAFAKFGWMVCITLRVSQPREDGLPSSQEEAALRAIETTVGGLANADLEATQVGSMLMNGRFDIYLHCREVEAVLREVDIALVDYPDYTAELRCWHDPTWKTFQAVLYPTSADWLYISARSDTPAPLFGRDRVTVAQISGK